MNFFPPNTILDEDIFTPRNLCPDYVVSHIWEAFILHIRSGALAGEPLAELESGLKQIEYRTIRSLPELRDSVYDSVLGLEECKNVSGALRKPQPRFSEITCPPAGVQMGVKWGRPGDGHARLQSGIYPGINLTCDRTPIVPRQ